jgi:hypothetical protein
LKTLAKAPSTRPSNRFSKRCRTLTAGPSVRDCAGPACDHVGLRRSLRYSRSLVLRGCAEDFVVPSHCPEDMMVSARGTPVPALIGWGMLLFAGASHGAYELGAIRLAPGPDQGLSLSTRPGRANAQPQQDLAEFRRQDCPCQRIARGSGGMADAHGSGPCARKGVRVQLPPSPPQSPAQWRAGLLLVHRRAWPERHQLPGDVDQGVDQASIAVSSRLLHRLSGPGLS